MKNVAFGVRLLAVAPAEDAWNSSIYFGLKARFQSMSRKRESNDFFTAINC